MKKLKLDLDQLAVESFVAAAGPETDGTIVGHGATGALGYTCVGCGTNPDVCHGGTKDSCPSCPPTMNPVLFECHSLAYCVETDPIKCGAFTE